MVRMCGPIFGSGKDVVLDIEICVTKGFKELKTNFVYAVSLINKPLYWLKGVPSDLIITHFEDKEVGDVGMIDARNEDNRLFTYFVLKTQNI